MQIFKWYKDYWKKVLPNNKKAKKKIMEIDFLTPLFFLFYFWILIILIY